MAEAPGSWADVEPLHWERSKSSKQPKPFSVSRSRDREHRGTNEEGHSSDNLDGESSDVDLDSEEADSPNEQDVDSLDEEVSIEKKLKSIKRLIDATQELTLDEVLSESTDSDESGEEFDTSQTGGKGSRFIRNVSSRKKGTASIEKGSKKTLHWLSGYLAHIFARGQKVSLLHDFVESEFFVIDGDSLMMACIHEATLSPRQNLHFFYLVESFLFDLTQKKAKYVITFFKDAECIWNESCDYLSIRTALILHLQQNTKVPVHTEFSNCFDERWKTFIDENHPYFVLIADKAFPRNRSGHPATGLFHILMLHTLGNGINIVLSSGMSQDILRVYGYHVCSKSTIISRFKECEADLKSVQKHLVQLASTFYDPVFITPDDKDGMKTIQCEIHHSYSKLKQLWPQGSDISRIVCVVSCSVAVKIYASKMTTLQRAGMTENKKDEPDELAIQGAADICRMYCLHVALLRNLPLSQRALRNNTQWTKPASEFLILRRMAEFFFLKNLAHTGWQVNMTYLSDLSDGHLLRTVANICTEMPSCTESECQLGSKIGGEYRNIWETVAKITPELDVGPAFPVLCTSGVMLQSVDKAEPDFQHLEYSAFVLQAVRERRDVLFQRNRGKSQARKNKQAWLQVAEEVSSHGVTPLTWIQCRKWFNDLIQAAKEKMAHNRREQAKTRGGLSLLHVLTPMEEEAMELAGSQDGRSIAETGAFSQYNTSVQKIPTIGLIPMSSALADEFIGDLLEQLPQLGSEDPTLGLLLNLKKFDEIFHWHSRKPIVKTHSERIKENAKATSFANPKERKRMLRSEQMYVVFERLYSESLEENTAVTIVTNQKAVVKDPSEQQQNLRKGNGKKSKKRAELIIEAQERKKKEEEERKAKEVWSSLQESVRKEMSQDIDKGIKILEKFLQNYSNDHVKVIAEMEAIKYCHKAWIDHCRSKAERSRDVQIAVHLMRRIHNVLGRHKDQLSPTLLTELAHYLKELGFLNLRDSVMEMIDTDQKHGVKTGQMKDPKFPVGLGAAHFQLKYMGPYLFRDERNDPDPRVQHFIPDTWQRELLDAVDNNESAVIVAPTSSGKTYASYYCMEKVLRTSDTGVVVYVAPTKALVNQVVATVYGRFTKSLPQGMVVCGCFTRDYRNHVENCQVLVTVPQCLEILLLSPHLQDWTKRMKYVIFDEVHCLGGEIGAEVWEHLLVIIRCPFLALSATISNPEDLTEWLQSVKTYWERVERSLEEPSSTSTSQKSKRKQQVEVGKGGQSFKVRLVIYEERYNDLEKYLCDLKDNEYKFIPYHPCAALTVNHIKNYGIPSDLALSPPECLRLYDTMVQVFPQWPRAQELEPEEYESFKNKVVIRKCDVRKYEAELKRELSGWVEAGLKCKVEDVLLLLDPTTERTFSQDQKKNFPLLVEKLQKMNALPALFFVFDIQIVENFAYELVQHLMEKLNSKRKPDDAKTKLQLKNKLQKLSKHLEKEETLTKPTRKQSEQLILYQTEYDMLYKKYQKHCELPPDCTLAPIATADKKLLDKIFFRMRKAHVSQLYQDMLLRGIGCHHASLNMRIRQAVEMLFRRGFVKVVSATSTLALGINMPCKTVVFLNDSVHLDALNYRQMSGRAGRRGMDNIGNVIFFNVPLPKVKRLIKANVPQLKGQFPLSITLVLRLMLLAARADDKADAKAKALSVLKYSMMTFNEPKKQNIVKFYFLFSLQFLLREGYLDQEGQPQGFAGLVMHIHHHEPANFVFIRFLIEGLLHKICRPLKPGSNTFSEDVMETLVFILANLFGRRYLLPYLAEEKITFQQSKVFLNELPDEFAASIQEYNRTTIQIFGRFLLSISNQANLDDEHKLPLSGTSFMGPQLPEATAFTSKLAKAIRGPSTVVSLFARLSGHTDLDLFKQDNVDPIIFRTLGIHKNNIPILSLKSYDKQGRQMPLNAYALDFYKHGCLDALHSDNGLNRGEAFNLLKDFSLVIATISTSLSELCGNEHDCVVLAFQQLNSSYSHKLHEVSS
ncbi:probable ATP-dependent RNA helicase DDX60 isoform X2 [Heterodontus francisci]|uniref:probable ATP-dependent RNA helicase DDX60 isoform X2 n=1 Tax=Heterodontus francisci TaxID=7792 RepID=UPI00355C6A05